MITMQLLLVALSVAAGVAAASQAAANAGLADRVGLPLALVVNTAMVLAGTVGLWLVAGRGPRPTSFASIPWLFFLGGLFGFTVIACMTFALPRLGAGFTIALVVLGQGAMALAIDHYGFWGVSPAAATLPRLVGVLLLVGGVVLLRAR